jgi:hypothetical protein
MPEERISYSDAEALFKHLIDRLQEMDNHDLAVEILDFALAPVVDEVDNARLAHLPRSLRSELSRKSVRERTSLERLEVALSAIDSRLREAPAVAASAGQLLGVPPENIRFEHDATAIEVLHPRSEDIFSLSTLEYGPLEEERVCRALTTLWAAVGRKPEPIRKER